MIQYHRLYTPEDSAVVFIDHQPQMTFGVASIDRATLINNVTLLAKVAKEFKVPTVLTAVESESFSGYIWPQLLDVFPRHVLRRRHRDPQAGEPGHERPRGSQVLAQIRHNFYTRFLLTRVLRVGVSPNYKGKQESGSGFCLQQ